MSEGLPDALHTVDLFEGTPLPALESVPPHLHDEYIRLRALSRKAHDIIESKREELEYAFKEEHGLSVHEASENFLTFLQRHNLIHR